MSDVFTSNDTGFTVSENQSVRLREVLGGHELMIVLRGKIMEAKGEPRWALVYGARVSAQSKFGLKYLGFANLHTPYTVRQVPDVLNHSYQIEFRLPLSPYQLNALEDHRDGSDLHFEVIATCVTGRGSTSVDFPEYPTWRIPAPQSEWIQQLNGAKASHVVLFEVTMPAVDWPSHKKEITDHLRKAERHYLAGLYTDCIMECRKGIEALKKTGPKFDWAVLQNVDSRKNLSKDIRLEALKSVGHLYAHPSGHTESEGGVSDYTRSDARLVFAITAALLSHG